MDETTTQFLHPIRPTARAIIRRGGEILVQLKEKPGSPQFLTLPGGRQEPGETLEMCVRRECSEEIGCDVEVGPLLHVADVYKTKGGGLQHQLEVLFSCEVPPDYEAKCGPAPDRSQIDTIWANLHRDAARFKPGYGAALVQTAQAVYLGVFHV